MTKSAVVSMTQSLAAEWANTGVRVNAIAPGFFHSRLADPALEFAEPKLKAVNPIPRVGEEGELKGVAVFLASDASSFVTGTVLAVDGGFLASGVNQ